MLSATSRRRDSRWRPSSCFFKRSLSLGRACMHHAKRSPRALWTRVPRMAGEIWYWLGGTVASVWAGASPFRDRCARDSHLRPPPPSSFSCYNGSGQLHSTAPPSGLPRIQPLSSRRHSSARSKWLQAQRSAPTKPVRTGYDEFAIFRTETDERFIQLESAMVEIEGAVKELCEGI